MADIKVNEPLLDEKLSCLESARSWSPRVISRLETMIRTEDDYALFRVNPIRYAADRNMPENEAIDVFLHATKCGLFEMDWHLACPCCGNIIENFAQLSQLHSHLSCDLCAIEQDVSFDDFIQVTFTILPVIRTIVYHQPDMLTVEDYYYKYMRAKGVQAAPGQPTIADSRWSGDLVMDYVDPGGKRDFALAIHPGVVLIREQSRSNQLAFVVQEQSAADTQPIQVAVRTNGFQALDREMPIVAVPDGDFVHHAPTAMLQQGGITLNIHNQSETRCRLWVVNYPPSPARRAVQFEPFLSGKRLLTTQTFRDLFRSDAVKSEEGIGVKDITFLFSDLKGSTAMYDSVGDPKAYFLVRQHFDVLGDSVARNNGAVVKTIGDAIMATFMNPVDAIQAGIDMIQKLEAFNRGTSQSLRLKIGIHRGHSIAVTLNDRLDYFGQTVNIAARVQGLADADEIYMTQEAFDYPGMTDVLTDHHVVQNEVDVKGVSGKLHVHKIAIRTKA